MTKPERPEAGVGEMLTFAQFRKANVTRCIKWHPAGIASWSPSDWLTAVTGELGELASLLKMRNRERDGLPGNKFSPSQKQIADEVSDVLTYLDLLAEVLGVNLGEAAAAKFNEVSERVGFPDRIELSAAVDWERECRLRDERLRVAVELLKRMSVRPSQYHDCDDYSRGYGQHQSEIATAAAKALSTITQLPPLPGREK